MAFQIDLSAGRRPVFPDSRFADLAVFSGFARAWKSPGAAADLGAALRQRMGGIKPLAELWKVSLDCRFTPENP